MSFTISKPGQHIPVTPHIQQELIVVTTVYNPIDKRLSINTSNTSSDDAITLLGHSAGLLAGYLGPSAVVVGRKQFELLQGA